MKIVFLLVETQKESWSKTAQEIYLEKISRFCDIELIAIKSPSFPRENKEQKIKEESRLLLSKIKKEDFLILFDEKGKELNSIKFSDVLKNAPSAKRVAFLIGGAFGTSGEIKNRANMTLSLSSMVMNHHVATTMALEQIYRALTIIKGIPYHNS